MFRVVRTQMGPDFEPRIPSVIHPEMMGLGSACSTNSKARKSHSPLRSLELMKALVSKSIDDRSSGARGWPVGQADR
jgi:hypothetical protein